MPVDLLAMLFVDPMPIGRGMRLVLLLPLAASVAVVYRTIRVTAMRQLPASALTLWLTIVFGMFGVGLALLIGYRLLL